MAAVRSRPQLPGSSEWITDENDQVLQFCAQDAEEFAFSARNEVEWLNEHMAEIFSKNQVNVIEIFKTPGKLRGKTPRTARKRNPLENREPLTDIFSSNPRPIPSPSHVASPEKPVSTFVVVEDPIAPTEASKPTKAHTDSGYHGLTEDDIDLDQDIQVLQSSAETHDTLEDSPVQVRLEQPVAQVGSEGRSTTERSFHSAREDITKLNILVEETRKDDPPTAEDVEMEEEPEHMPSAQRSEPGAQNTREDVVDLDLMDKDLDDDLVVDASRSPSQGSSPARALVRKSSLTFAALPAREPLTTKKSMGASVSRTSNMDQSKGTMNRGSFLGRITGGRSLGGARQPESAPEDIGNEVEMCLELTQKETLTREESDGDAKMKKLHNKSSTQRLHERINLLGKSQPARPTKSIPAAAPFPQPVYPDLSNADFQARPSQQAPSVSSKTAIIDASLDRDDDDWIQPPRLQANGPSRPQLSKSTSADVMEDIRDKQTISDQDFGLGPREASPLRRVEAQKNNKGLSRAFSAAQSSPTRKMHTSGDANTGKADLLDISTTPVDSPAPKRYVDGPLSASKSKLQSIMKTARGLFSSSAGVSAQAKIETLSPTLADTREESHQPSTRKALVGKNATPGAKYVKSGEGQLVAKNTDVRKTRSSTEKEERRKEAEGKERQRAEAEIERARQEQDERCILQKQEQEKQEQVKATGADFNQTQGKAPRRSPRSSQDQDPPLLHSDAAEDNQPSQSMGPPAPHAPVQPSQLQRPKDVRRPMKPAKEAAPKPKPQPVAIRVGTLSQRIPLTNVALSSSLQESLPPPQSKQPAIAKKGSKVSLQTSTSNTNLKGSTTAAAKPKALLAAERKKKQDEEDAQRKLDRKREIERERAAQQEGVRRQEQLQRQDVERQRERDRSAAAEDPQKIAQRQAIEKRRMELNKKENQKLPQRLTADYASVQSQIGSTVRPELGGSRPPSRLHNPPEHSRPVHSQYAANPSKQPNKRVFNPENDESCSRPARPQGVPSYKSNEAKRRRTEDEEPEEFPIRPTMAPPIRQSNIRKDGPKASIFSSNYSTAPPPAAHHNHGQSLLKSTTANQAYQQHAHQNQILRPGHHDMAKYTNGKIPFAEAPNPPHQSQPHKTPLPSKLAPPPAKASPQYQNGENIHLDDIPTDSEEGDSDSDAASKPANLPDWAQSPQLRELLMTQDEHMDADAVFGPLASPHMEEMFRERHHRFRSRTSSANWAGQDRLTEEEIRRDVEARQRLRREGGWTFGL